MTRTPIVPLHLAISRIAAEQPDAPAVLGLDGTVLSYARLDRAADAWARELRRRGVRAGDVVPVLMTRSPVLPPVLLAILKCGAAYAALDHRWPDARIADVLAKLGPCPVVLGEDHREAAERLRLDVWCPPPLRPASDAADPAEAGLGTVGLEHTDAGATACVFFTSGTTGESKGVLSPHSATMRLFDPAGPMPFGPGSVMPLSTYLTWDVAAFELWGMLATGGTCVPVPDDFLTPRAVADLIGVQGVDTLWLTTSLFHLLVTEDIDCFDGLRRLYVGGERMSQEHARTFLHRHPGIEFYNCYGPVEVCMVVTTHRVTLADCEDERGIPLGPAVPHTEILVMDEDRPCETGEPGELCMAGPGVARGYLGDDALTKAKFTEIAVGGPDGGSRNVRVYRSGDMGVIDERGRHYFLGRTDRQIKLRGHRVELDGIEAEVHAAAPGTVCAVVALPGASGGYEHLALFYARPPDAADPGPDPLRLRTALATRLPGYAVPDTVAALDRLPLTVNGKIDYAALVAERHSRKQPWVPGGGGYPGFA